MAPVDSCDRSNLSPQLNIRRCPSEPRAPFGDAFDVGPSKASVVALTAIH